MTRLTNLRASRRGCDGRERGAAALEFGLVSPIIFAVLFGTLTYGLWFNDSLNLRQGLREAARQGVVGEYGDTATCGMTYTASVPSANVKKLMCQAESEVGALTGETYIKVALPAHWVRGQQILVCGMVHADRLPGLVPLPDDRMIRWSSRMSIEKVAPGQVEAGGEELPPTGSTWSWCT
jgi:Flp pilus assembly protein TadG